MKEKNQGGLTLTDFKTSCKAKVRKCGVGIKIENRSVKQNCRPIHRWTTFWQNKKLNLWRKESSMQMVFKQSLVDFLI